MTEATLSYGVQQLLHARLNKQYEIEIEKYKQTGGMEGLPPFSCDNQIECVDSQNVQSTLQKFGRILASTGTAGNKIERMELKSVYQIDTQLKIPPRRKSKLAYLGTEFCQENTSYFFGPATQVDAIKRTLRKTRLQPVMIVCEDINKVEALREKLEKEFPQELIQTIHAGNAGNFAEFERKVKLAGNPVKLP